MTKRVNELKKKEEDFKWKKGTYRGKHYFLLQPNRLHTDNIYSEKGKRYMRQFQVIHPIHSKIFTQ
jgi:hypothetical protein